MLSQKRAQVKLIDYVQHIPSQMIVGQPVPQTGRQQQLLLSIARQKVLRHADILLSATDITTGHAADLRDDSLHAADLRDSLATGSILNRP